MSDFSEYSIFVERFKISNYLPQFNIFYLVNDGHSAIKVHVNKVQYCRAEKMVENKSGYIGILLEYVTFIVMLKYVTYMLRLHQ